MKTILVIAAPGRFVPQLDLTRVITDTEAVEVPAHTWYLRHLRSGDLLPVEAGDKPAATQPATKKRKGA
ncbi:hypothetical protein A9J41_14655 [Laribacter hongkongensis]|uniref:hypothetical protein n=1 Tax=Laribacter hongkongensis TaxID=168471 RepID=UPI001877D9B4|nr:hypothetical protein [Laribacter hongkongensis]MBE5529191.1 hypothetical protein [Laribacter hongkongensis]